MIWIKQPATEKSGKGRATNYLTKVNVTITGPSMVKSTFPTA